ncbi:uncharacterized protein LOC113557883 [Rhopalosiphum maidis]|uniref:uncharacterized protein LOC113557883 n=1 Tax=Rhopalosiphum maidis TaxID=43146 RepID=UPI000EFEAEE0|nr:uncharacterized protein LOC113557883 [Rhopalosiphum maidis]
MKILYAILLTILSCLWKIVAGAVFLVIVWAAIRHDIVAAAISESLRRQRRKTTPMVTAAEKNNNNSGDWTTAAERLAFEAVPSAVRIQMLVNRLQKYETDHLDPLDKRLEKVKGRLTKMMAKCRRARMAYDFESSEVNALYASYNRETMSIGTNTDIYKSTIVKEQPESSSVAMVSGVEPSTQSLSLDMKSRPKSIPSANQAPSELAELTSTPSIVPQQESLFDAFKEITPYLISTVLWFKNALTSDAYRRKAIRVYNTLHSILHSEYLKKCFKFAFDSFDNFVRLYTHINFDNEMTSVMIRVPATENDYTFLN